MSLTITLRVAATLLIIAAVLQYLMADLLPIKTIVVAHILFILSFFSDNHRQRISVVSLGLAIVVPIGAWRMYQAGSASLGFFIFNSIIFIYLAFISFRALKNSE